MDELRVQSHRGTIRVKITSEPDGSAISNNHWILSRGIAGIVARTPIVPILYFDKYIITIHAL
jgi:hypothetical protein